MKENKTNIKTIKIKDFSGENVELIPKLFLYDVPDFIGKSMNVIGIQFLYEEDDTILPYATFTKVFGEFIGVKNVAYVDTNNCWFAPQILEAGIAKETGFTKRSGFYEYPLWVFDEEFLREIGGEEYQKYSDKFDKYMRAFEEE